MVQKRPVISIVAALGLETFAIGKDNKLLWRIPEDLKHFRKITGNHPLIMGRKTFESLNNRPLKGFFSTSRKNFVVTRDRNFRAENCEVCFSLKEAMQKAAKLYHGEKEVFVIGGGQLYKEAFPFAKNLYLTFVDDPQDGDIFFPRFKIDTDKMDVIKFDQFNGTPYMITRIQKDAEDLFSQPSKISSRWHAHS